MNAVILESFGKIFALCGSPPVRIKSERNRVPLLYAPLPAQNGHRITNYLPWEKSGGEGANRTLLGLQAGRQPF